jgi:hypothetical protein
MTFPTAATGRRPCCLRVAGNFRRGTSSRANFWVEGKGFPVPISQVAVHASGEWIASDIRSIGETFTEVALPLGHPNYAIDFIEYYYCAMILVSPVENSRTSLAYRRTDSARRHIAVPANAPGRHVGFASMQCVVPLMFELKKGRETSSSWLDQCALRDRRPRPRVGRFHRR